jgi:hypothetical protein
MSAGYCFGRVFDLDSADRRRLIWRLGVALTLAFIALRAVNLYGDPSPWSAQSNSLMSVLSFLNATKYPPSLAYLLMTLGPALMALAALERITVGDRHPLLVFGRVPLFYYVVHWYALHFVALALAWGRYGRFDFILGLPPSVGPFSVGYPADYGYPLWVVYVAWVGIVAAIYPACLWFARLKQRSRAMWLSYL